MEANMLTIIATEFVLLFTLNTKESSGAVAIFKVIRGFVVKEPGLLGSLQEWQEDVSNRFVGSFQTSPSIVAGQTTAAPSHVCGIGAVILAPWPSEGFLAIARWPRGVAIVAPSTIGTSPRLVVVVFAEGAIIIISRGTTLTSKAQQALILRRANKAVTNKVVSSSSRFAGWKLDTSRTKSTRARTTSFELAKGTRCAFGTSAGELKLPLSFF
mmetsp:Transcript_35477/g.85992  ORF Transcript_35477/g.85992 Transcript_35477/m.85992 type:complete len:213 (-) Transcript_35477:2022-2660(-)